MADKKHVRKSAVKLGKDELFLMGSTTKERAKLLYIRSQMNPKTIVKTLRAWGDEVNAKQLDNWTQNEKWLSLRRKYVSTYDTAKYNKQAEIQAQDDAYGEKVVREVYSKCCEQLMNMVHQKLKMKVTPDMDYPVISTGEFSELTKAMEKLQVIHFKSLGIPDLVVIDPTSGTESIRLIPGDEMPLDPNGQAK